MRIPGRAHTHTEHRHTVGARTPYGMHACGTQPPSHATRTHTACTHASAHVHAHSVHTVTHADAECTWHGRTCRLTHPCMHTRISMSMDTRTERCTHTNTLPVNTPRTQPITPTPAVPTRAWPTQAFQRGCSHSTAAVTPASPSTPGCVDTVHPRVLPVPLAPVQVGAATPCLASFPAAK